MPIEDSLESAIEEEEKVKEVKFEIPIKEDYSKMKTEVLIPFEAAPKDPVWLTKKHAGKKLTSDEY